MSRAVSIISATFLLLAASEARSATPISACGTTITSAGSYVVTKDLKLKPGSTLPCIGVDSNYVTIDLGGFAIDCGGESAAGVSEVKTVHTGLVIRDGMIVGCLAGLAADGNALVEDVTVWASINSGIAVENPGIAEGATVLRSVSINNGFYGVDVGLGALLDNTVVNNVPNLKTDAGSASLNNLAP